MIEIEQNIVFPLVVAFVGFAGLQVFSYFKSRARKLKIAEELEMVTKIKEDISKMVEEKNQEQNKQIESFYAALQEFSKVISKFEHSTNNIIQLSKKMIDDMAEFKNRLDKLEKRVNSEFKAVEKLIQEMGKQVLKLQTTHNFCHPGNQIHEHDFRD